jgi:hypothetical protein
MAPVISRDQSSDATQTVECGNGKLVDWTSGKAQWIITKDVDRCFTLSIITKEHGFLFHFNISDDASFKETYYEFSKWWAENKGILTSGRLFMFCPLHTISYDAEDITEFLMDELPLQIKLQPKMVDLKDLKATGSSFVELYSDGTGEMPAVRCNGTKITPAVPLFR